MSARIHSPKPRNKVRIMHGNKVRDYTKADIKVVRRSDGSKRYVWKSKSKLGEKNRWAQAVKRAYKHLGLVSFVPLRKGSQLYRLAKVFYKSKLPLGRASRSPRRSPKHARKSPKQARRSRSRSPRKSAGRR